MLLLSCAVLRRRRGRQRQMQQRRRKGALTIPEKYNKKCRFRWLVCVFYSLSFSLQCVVFLYDPLSPSPPPFSFSLIRPYVKLIDSVSVCECSAVQREKQQNWTEENSSSLFSFLLFFLLLEGEGEEAEPSKETIHRRSVWVWSALPLSFRVEDSPRQPQRRVYFFFFFS